MCTIVWYIYMETVDLGLIYTANIVYTLLIRARYKYTYVYTCNNDSFNYSCAGG